MKKQAVLSLSGGMDSSTLLLHLLSHGYEVTALSFDYGQKHKVELERAESLVKYINSEWTKQHPPFDNDKTTSFYPVTHQIIKLDGLQELLNSALVTGGSDVPEGHYAHENMKETVVPNRNKIFSSIIQAVALSLATTGEKHPVDIALGIHAGDFVVYLDCRAEFRDADLHAFRVGNWDSELVNYYTPYLNGTKLDILKDGERCCKHLGLSFDEVYSRTNTSYKPIFIQDEKVPFVMPTYNTIKKKGNWYSDYKSAASVERIEAFIKLGRPDPVAYADLENGPVSWEVARDHVLKVLENNSGGSRS